MAVATDRLQELARMFRVDSIRASSAAGSGHPTSAMSAAELMAVLMANYLRYDFDSPENPANDRLIFSKGHASNLLYSMFRAAGAITDDQMMTYRQLGSLFEGHPTPRIPWVEVATGSLGQGLPIGVGVALAGKYLDNLPYRTWVLCGDSELAEGSIWEAFDHASFYKLGNLTAIIDMNRLGQRGETAHGWDGDLYAERATSFGWHAIVIDGHDLEQIDRAYKEAIATEDKPTAIIARTVKGKGISSIENQNGFHGKALDAEEAAQAIEELGGPANVTIEVQEPPSGTPANDKSRTALNLPAYGPDDSVATRRAYGDALKALGDTYQDVVALDGEVSNSTYSEVFGKAHPDRFFEMFIAEQQMVAAAIGISTRGYTTFASTFGAFMSRAYDFIRMAAVSRVTIRLCGSHAGVSIGEDGPSQMALEDLAMLRAVHGSTVLYPCDPNQTAKLVALMANEPGISYIRTTRGTGPTIYSADEHFEIGGSKVLRASDDDQVTIIAAGVTLHEAAKAYEELAAGGLNACLIDLYSVKPVDATTVRDALETTNGRLIVVEDHWPEGGIASAVLEAMATYRENGSEPVQIELRHLAPREMPTSATPAEQLDAAGISARHIVAAARELVG